MTALAAPSILVVIGSDHSGKDFCSSFPDGGGRTHPIGKLTTRSRLPLKNYFMTNTELKIEYIERSWDYERPDYLEQALENDYTQNKYLYSDKTFKYIKIIFLINPEISSDELLNQARMHFQEITKNGKIC